MAEGQGFEPWDLLQSHDFQSCPFGRSGTPPGGFRQPVQAISARHGDESRKANADPRLG
jgi:hypothetical protein